GECRAREAGGNGLGARREGVRIPHRAIILLSRPDGEDPMLLSVQTAPGEFLDKLTILEIKAERIAAPVKLANVRREREVLPGARWLNPFPSHCRQRAHPRAIPGAGSRRSISPKACPTWW